MWEVRAADGHGDALISWVLQNAPGRAAVYRSSDERVVVVDPDGRAMPDVPDDLVARPPHAWHFELVRG